MLVLSLSPFFVAWQRQTCSPVMSQGLNTWNNQPAKSNIGGIEGKCFVHLGHCAARKGFPPFWMPSVADQIAEV